MRIFTCIAALAFCLCLAGAAQAEGKFAELMRQRAQAKSDDGLDINGGNASCAEYDAKVVKMMNGHFGKRLKGREPDIKDLPYGEKPRQKMDIYLPPASQTPAPVIFMVHGGGWCTGDKKMIGSKVKHWVPKGFVFVSANYPMVGDGSMAGAQAEDIARALVFVQKNAGKWGGDAEKIILMGHSAGAHLISLVNADAELRERMGVQPVLGAVSLDSGAINVVTQMPIAVRILKTRYQEAFGTEEAGWIAVSRSFTPV
jgi:arylformamidase